jgi:DNA-binding NtrC family response regulator
MTDHTPEPGPRCRVLIVDDEPAFSSDMTLLLGDRFEVTVAADTAGALAKIAEARPDVVLLDITLKDGVDGFVALARIKAVESPPEVIMLTGMQGPGAVVQAIKGGAFHYAMKDADPGELANLIGLASEKAAASRRLASLETQLRRLGGELVVYDPLMLRMMKDVEKVAPTAATVLVVGESGTGKELVARRVHELSARAAGPFVAISCGAVAEAQAELELFGQVRGAFPETTTVRTGFFARAQGGTLYLDEVGRASLALQAKLLRVLETREFLPVGAAAPVRADIRVVASASHDLQRMCDDGQFLKELFFRLNVFSLVLPPLRKRREDIVPLAEHFLDVFGAEMGRPGLHFSAAAKEYLVMHEWRGNVRDLRNRVERAVILSDGEEVHVDVLLATRFDHGAAITEMDAAMESAQQEYLTRLMNECDWNVTKASKLAGLTREGLSRLITKYRLKDGRM